MYIVYIQKPRLLSHDPVKYYLSGIERYLKYELLNFLIYENIQRVLELGLNCNSHKPYLMPQR